MQPCYSVAQLMAWHGPGMPRKRDALFWRRDRENGGMQGTVSGGGWDFFLFWVAIGNFPLEGDERLPDTFNVFACFVPTTLQVGGAYAHA